MQDVALLTGKHGVAYIPIAEARGITTLMIKQGLTALLLV